jgi:phosphoribosylaminoimidazolecarboxamide formyltransferase/IMP cyclohydrolase
MTQENNQGLRTIRRALISVSDKTGIVDFARKLRRFNVEIISTGGTAKALQEAGINVRDISDVTGFPEMMDGRVKTLHPRIHGGLLALRNNPEHLAAKREHGIEPIDMVVVNLYPFEQTIAKPGVTLEEAIEEIDIGGPAMIRSAAKNFGDVVVVVSRDSYKDILEEMRRNDGAVSHITRRLLAIRAFERTAAYDAIVCRFLIFSKEEEERVNAARQWLTLKAGGFALGSGSGRTLDSLEDIESPPSAAVLELRKAAKLRYGENPHQRAALYDFGETTGIARAEILSGREMSFNNYVDADAAWQLVCDFDKTACAIFKHTNPAGVGLAATTAEAYRKALATDRISAFGGIVAFNRAVDVAAAKAVVEVFTEVIIAPEYQANALEVLRTKKNLRVLRVGAPEPLGGLEYKQISGGMLVQTRDTHELKREGLKVVSKRQPTEAEISSLLFAWIVCKHTKSNAIVYARDGQTVGVGAGQMSRVDSVKIGAMRARLPVQGSVLASDAFFPFRDGIDEAAKHGITAIIQPGGSVRDAEDIAAADEHGLAMVFTGIRHFKH